jgi:hypothetical protein
MFGQTLFSGISLAAKHPFSFSIALGRHQLLIKSKRRVVFNHVSEKASKVTALPLEHRFCSSFTSFIESGGSVPNSSDEK